jgi:hypothetical protein
MQAVGADLVVFFNARADVVRGSEIPDALHVLADPKRRVYDPLGTTRSSWLSLGLSSVEAGIRAVAAGELPKATRADMQRLGADAAVRADGEVALLHRATSPDDRLDPAELVAALENGAT